MEQDYRKLIKFGKSSHVVSLPTEWINKNKLNKGDKVFFEETSDNKLIFFAENNTNKDTIKEIIIDINNKSIEYGYNKIIAAYINGYNLVKILDKNIDRRAKEIRSLIHSLAGLEVIEQSNDKMVIKDFLNIRDVSFDTTLRRIDIVIRNMLINTRECFKKDNRVSINSSDMDVNRLCFLIIRGVKLAFDNPQLSKQLNLNHYELMNYNKLSFSLENLGDEIKRVARLFRLVKNRKTEKILLDYFDRIEKIYIKSINSYYNKDEESSLNNLVEIKKTLIEINDLLKYDTYLTDARVIEKLKNMIITSKNISRVALNISLSS